MLRRWRARDQVEAARSMREGRGNGLEMGGRVRQAMAVLEWIGRMQAVGGLRGVVQMVSMLEEVVVGARRDGLERLQLGRQRLVVEAIGAKLVERQIHCCSLL